MLQKLDIYDWNSLRDFIEGNEITYINLFVHIDTLRLYVLNMIKENEQLKLLYKKEFEELKALLNVSL